DSYSHALTPDTAGKIAADSIAKEGQDTAAADSAAVIAAPEVRYTISGVVKDKATGEGIPFATVFFPGTDVGTPADLDGKFSLAFPRPPGDTLRVTAIGYGTWNRRINLAGNPNPVLTIELTREAAALSEFVFYAGEDPAITLLKKIIAAKPDNNPDRLQHYKYNVYNKLEVDIRNLSRKKFDRLHVPMIKKLDFIYNNLDSYSD